MLVKRFNLIVAGLSLIVLAVACSGQQTSEQPQTNQYTPVRCQDRIMPISVKSVEGPLECYQVGFTRSTSDSTLNKEGQPSDFIRDLIPGTKVPTRSESLTVYTAMDEKQFSCFMSNFKRYVQENSEPQNVINLEAVTLNICTASTGPVTNQILSERENPQVDVIWNIATTSMLRVQAAGMLRPLSIDGTMSLTSTDTLSIPSAGQTVTTTFTTTLDDRIIFDQSSGKGPSWVSHNVFMSALCVNPQKLAALDIGFTASDTWTWEDLIDEKLKGHILMANPNVSGTAYQAVAGWVQMFGEAAGWQYMNDLDKNIIEYLDSSSQVCRNVADPDKKEAVIGISRDTAPFEILSSDREDKSNNRPTICPESNSKTGGLSGQVEGTVCGMKIIFPSDQSGWEVDAAALVRKSETHKLAELFYRWAVSDAAVAAYGQTVPVTTWTNERDDLAKYGFQAGITPDQLRQRLDGNNNLRWSSANHDRLVAEWLNRYESKAQSGSRNIEAPSPDTTAEDEPAP